MNDRLRLAQARSKVRARQPAAAPSTAPPQPAQGLSFAQMLEQQNATQSTGDVYGTPATWLRQQPQPTREPNRKLNRLSPRTSPLSVALSQEEHDALKAHANWRGERFSTWARNALLEKLRAETSEPRRES